ncbi:MAG: PAS domain S-box protein [Nitrospira sp.]|nr:PAS domain S-box protein [Nitrospira sp.]
MGMGWEWDIVSGAVQWFGMHERSAGSWHGRNHDHIRPLTDMLHPDDRARVWQKLNRSMARCDIPYADEYRVMHPDGSVRWISGTGRFYYDDAGQPVRMTGVVQDITERKQTQEALRVSEERFAKAFRTSPHPIGITEAATGRCLEVNDVCLQLFGFRREEVIGNTTLMLGIWPNEEDRARLVEQLQAGRPVHNLELSFKTKMGDVRHILVSSDVAELNGTLCLVTVGNDITERKVAEEKLHESEERLRLAQSAANIGTFDWDIAAHTVVWSPETERIWGLSVGQFGGTYEHWRRQVHPDDAAEVERIVRLSLENPDIPYAYEHRIIRPDGTVRWIHANTTTRRDTAGRPIRMVGVNFDITARKQAEAKLRDSEARFRNVFEHAGIGIAIANLYGGSVQCNPAYCAMLGYSEDELRNLDFSQVVHPEDRDVNQTEIKRLLTEELPYFEIENRYVHKNGEPVWVHKFVSLLRDHERHPKCLVALVTDITERRKAEEALHQAKEHLQRWTTELEEAVNEKTAELVQSQERLRALASELSLAEQRERKRLATALHDHLQQMLVCGKMAIGEVQRVAAGDPACGPLLERVDDMLSDALTYSRTLVAELSPPVLQDHGLGAGLIWLGEYIMRRHGQTVTVLVPENHELKLPEAHRVLLFQSVRELLINASKHAGTGKAAVRLERRDGNLYVTVSDEGKGFDLTAGRLATAGIPSGGIPRNLNYIAYMSECGHWVDHLSSNQPRAVEPLPR